MYHTRKNRVGKTDEFGKYNAIHQFYPLIGITFNYIYVQYGAQKLGDMLVSIHEYFIWHMSRIVCDILWWLVSWSCCYIHVLFNYCHEPVPKLMKLLVVIMFILNLNGQCPTSWIVVNLGKHCSISKYYY